MAKPRLPVRHKNFLKVAIALVGCSGACTEPSRVQQLLIAATVPKTSLIRTNREEYRAVITSDAITISVIATFTNATRDTLTLHPCSQQPPYPLVVQLDRLQGSQWRIALAPICNDALLLDPPTLMPGQVRVDTLQLRGWRLANTDPTFSPGPLAGQYRLHYYGVYRKWYPRNPPPDAKDQLGEQLDDSLRVSNVFRIME
ncbi:MAG: hypothetical protein M3Z54_03080 [Gemmatimonadota bacterium]|nr:hypothetical protein [Gemmatimonadota bacterium]